MTAARRPPELARLAESDRRLTIEFDAPFGARTTYRVGGRALVLAVVEDPGVLPGLAAAAAADGLPVIALGRGSNTLVADAGFAGVVIVLGSFADRIEIPALGEEPTVHAGSAVLLPVLARRLVPLGLRGLEWAVGVPGSVGGAVRMNAGGHGSDMASSLCSAEIADLASGEVRRWAPDEIGLTFRGSSLVDGHVVIGATLALEWGDATGGGELMETIVAWRRANQPGGQNCGSVFVNPVPGEVSAGSVIDSLGLRGLRIGSAEVSPKHANFIQADPGGSADDVVAVMRCVHERVLVATGYDLRSEVRLIGFDRPQGGVSQR